MSKIPRLIDAHTHVQFAAFDGDRDEVINRSLDQNIWLVNVGSQKDTSAAAVKLTEKYAEGVYAVVGLHPIHTGKSFHDKDELEPSSAKDTEGQGGFNSRGEVFDYDYYKSLALNPKVIAIGECGLDYFRVTSNKQQETSNKQKEVFIQQINLASEVKKPLMIHCRDAYKDLIDILVTCHGSLVSGIVHFFSGTKEEAKKLLDMGFYFTFGGVITFSRDYDEIIKSVPLNRLLLETDAPYVAPEPYRGRRNEPVYVAEVAKKLAEIKGLSVEEISAETVKNTRTIFKI